VGEPGRGDRIARWIVVPLLVMLVIVVSVFYGLFSTRQVSGPSMEPTLLDQDRILVSRGYERALRTDVVVVSEDTADGGRYEVVKRVAAIGGDTVEFRAGVAYINGSPEQPARGSGGGRDAAPITLAPDEVYLLGDNRGESLDSRFYGPLKTSSIEGRAVFVFAPFGRMGAID